MTPHDTMDAPLVPTETTPLQTPPHVINNDTVKGPETSIWTILYFYFTLGINFTLPVLPTKMLLMDDLAVQPATMAILLAWISLPWALKPLYGCISDSFPILGYRRIPYLLCGIAINAISWFAVAFIGASLGLYAAFSLLFISSLSLVIADVACDSLLVECVQRMKMNPAKGIRLMSNTYIAWSGGSLIASLLSGFALGQFNMTCGTMFAVTGGCALSTLCTSLFMRETRCITPGPDDPPPLTLLARLKVLLSFWRQEEIWKTSIFVLMMSCSPSSGDAVFYFERNRLGFSMDFLGVLQTVGFAGAVFGAWVYRQCLRDMRFRNVLRLTTLTAFGLGMTTLLLVKRWNLALRIPDRFFVFGDTIALSVCTNVALMPISILAARIAPKGSEGTIYASIISLSNLSDVISQSTGGWLTQAFGVRSDNFDNLAMLVLVCNLTTLTPLLLISFVPDIAPCTRSHSDPSQDALVYDPPAILPAICDRI